MKLAHRLLLCAVVMVACVSCDQATKSAAKTALDARPPLVCLAGTVRLIYAENPGGFLSFGDTLPASVRTTLFVAFAALVVVGLLAIVVRDERITPARVLALALVAAGGVGNLIDRVSTGTVRDFLNVGVGPVRTGIFNVADVAITTGVVLLVVLKAAPRRKTGPCAPTPSR